MSTSQINRSDQAAPLTEDDLQLVQAAKEGDIHAFDELVKRHERQMFRIAYHLLHNREDAQDAVQEAFLKAYQKLVQFQAKAKFSTWLGRITVNEALTKLRREPVYWSSLAEDSRDESEILPKEVVDWAPNPEVLYNTSELRAILEKNLRRLKPRLRTVFILRDVEGLSLEDAAQTLGLTVAAVKARSWRARLLLREWLGHYFSQQKPLTAYPPAVRGMSAGA